MAARRAMDEAALDWGPNSVVVLGVAGSGKTRRAACWRQGQPGVVRLCADGYPARPGPGPGPGPSARAEWQTYRGFLGHLCHCVLRTDDDVEQLYAALEEGS